MKKDNTTLLLIIGAAAVVGYLYYKKSLSTGIAAGALPSPTTIPGLGQLQTPVGIATEAPNITDTGVIAPSIDPTGMQLTFY